jgi:hypothetical protein
MVAASGDRILELEIRTEIGRESGTGAACEMQLLAVDGVYLETTRSGSYVDHYAMVQAQRASMAVRCASAGTYYFQTASAIDSGDDFYTKVGDIEVQSVQLLVTLNVAGSQSSLADPPSDLTSVPRPSYLADIRSVENVQNWSIGIDQSGCCEGTPAKAWLGLGTDCTMECYGRTDCEALFGSNYTVDDLHVLVQPL